MENVQLNNYFYYYYHYLLYIYVKHVFHKCTKALGVNVIFNLISKITGRLTTYLNQGSICFQQKEKKSPLKFFESEL